MSTVVVQSHPLESSYNAALFRAACAGLDRAGERYLTFRLGNGERPVASDLAGVERLVLVYPTWGGGHPAMLLDWIQDMLADPVAFADVRRLVGVATHGSSLLVNILQGEWGRKNLAKTVLGRCAPGAAFEWLPLYKVDRLPPEAFEQHLATIEDSFAAAPITSHP